MAESPRFLNGVCTEDPAFKFCFVRGECVCVCVWIPRGWGSRRVALHISPGPCDWVRGTHVGPLWGGGSRQPLLPPPPLVTCTVVENNHVIDACPSLSLFPSLSWPFLF